MTLKNTDTNDSITLCSPC